MHSREIYPPPDVMCWNTGGISLDNNIVGVIFWVPWSHSLVGYTGGGNADVILDWDASICEGPLGLRPQFICQLDVHCNSI